MKAITITFQDLMLKDKEPQIIHANVHAVTNEEIERILKRERSTIDKWLLIGKASFAVTDDETGEVLTDGKWSCNVFDGRGNYQFNKL